MHRARASAPGKLILAGEHAAVYGHPALVASLGQRATAVVTSLDERGRAEDATVEIELPALGVRSRSSLRELVDGAAAAREHWQRAMVRPAEFKPLHRDAAALVRLALGEAFAARPAAGAPRSMRVEVSSEIPLGAGCGSSAAVASAVVAATLALLDRSLDPHPAELAELERIVLEVERRQHGAPSGVDAATVLRGGVLWCRREDGKLVADPVRAAAEGSPGGRASPLDGLGAFALLHTGTPRESTGEVVAMVRARRDAESLRIDAALQRIADSAQRLRVAVESGDAAAVVAPLEQCARGLEEIGVVPGVLRELTRRVEAAGGAAKVSGAGTATGDAAGVMLVYHPSPSALLELRRWLPVGSARWLPGVALGGPGLEVE
jgi:mevalonate kinase